jgi:hypothetical protein
MSAVREAWTDIRLDDLSDRMDRRFEQIDQRFDRVETDLRELRAEMNARLNTMTASMVVGFVSVLGSVIATGL